jgi:type II secretory pathway component PulK
VKPRSGYVLIAVLIVIVVLSLAAYQFTDLMTSEYRAASRSADSAQAKLAAASGVHYAAAMLADPNSFYGQLGGNPYAQGAFADQAVHPGDNPRQTSYFGLVAVAPTSQGSFEPRYGAVVDEMGKLNINTLIQLDSTGEQLFSALMMLPNMTDAVADAIVDWVDTDDTARPSGAESSYYLSMPQGYQAKNGPLNSIDELLLVKGVTPQMLFGTDRNRNGVADDDANGGAFDHGLAAYLTVYGRELNVDSTGVLRENINESEDLVGLHERLTARVGAELADFILAAKIFSTSRLQTASATLMTDGGMSIQVTATATPLPNNAILGSAGDLAAAVAAALQDGSGKNRRKIKSLVDLSTYRVTLPKPQGAPSNQPTIVVDSPLAGSRFSELFGPLMDKTTTTTNVELTPRINVNTAPREVLLTIPNLTEADADAILAQRDSLNPSDPATVSGAWLLTTAGLSPDTFKKIEKYVTGRTMVYRVQSLGYLGQNGPVARVEAVIDTNQGAPRILYFRDLTALDTPRGFEPMRP